VDETGPVFLDEEPVQERPQEPSSAWQADATRQAGFGGERDHRVSWGAPGKDPRVPSPAPVPADPPRGALPGVRAPGRGPDDGPSDGTVAIRPTRRGPGPAADPGTPPRSPDTAQPAVDSTVAIRALRAARRAKDEDPAVPAQASVASRPVAPAAASVAAGPDRAEQPVVPWKPPVSDPFLQMAQAQAAARPAGLGKRFAARLIDSLVLGAIVGALAVPLVARVRAHLDEKLDAARQSGRTVTVWLLDATTAGYLGGLLAAFLVVGVLYETLPTAKWGRTPGKKLCGLSVHDIESHEPPTFGAALRRWLVYSVLGILVVGVVNVLWCLIDRPWRQCWHDKAAHTFVARG
jgi:uncharacterized RDD family membrane protein YckC